MDILAWLEKVKNFGVLALMFALVCLAAAWLWFTASDDLRKTIKKAGLGLSALAVVLAVYAVVKGPTNAPPDGAGFLYAPPSATLLQSVSGVRGGGAILGEESDLRFTAFAPRTNGMDFAMNWSADLRLGHLQIRYSPTLVLL